MLEKNFVTYEYLTKTIERNEKGAISDLYRSLGWEVVDENSISLSKVCIHFKRDRKIRDKSELNRLQKKAEKVLLLNVNLEKSKKKAPTLFAYLFGSISALVMGGGMSLTMIENLDRTAFIIGIIIGIVGIVLCSVNYFIYSKMLIRRSNKINPLIEENEEKIATICEQGQLLISGD